MLSKKAKSKLMVSITEHRWLGGCSIPIHRGWDPLQVPSSWQVRVADPTSTFGALQLNVTSDLKMKLRPSLCPLASVPGSPQNLAAQVRRRRRKKKVRYCWLAKRRFCTFHKLECNCSCNCFVQAEPTVLCPPQILKWLCTDHFIKTKKN